MNEIYVKKIVKKVLKEELDENATWEGVKGFFKGKGYYYTKYLTELEYVLEDMGKKLVDDSKIQKKLTKLKEKTDGSSMDSEKKRYINLILSRTQQVIDYTDRMIEHEMNNLKRLKNY